MGLRTRRRLCPPVTLALLTLALLPGCGPSSDSTNPAGPPAKILMVQGYILRELLAQDKPLAGSFAGRTTYAISTSAPAPAVPRLPGTIERTVKYTSYSAFAADMAAGRVPRSVHAVLYDIEMWPSTPLTEQQNPLVYMVRFSKLARAHGLLPILAPARDLMLVRGASCGKRPGENLSQAYIRCGLAGADARAGVLVVQSQIAQFDVLQFRNFLVLAARQARAGNPRVAVLAQLATAPQGHVASLTQLVTAARSVGELVQGFSLNVRVADVPTADGLLWSLKQR